MLIDTPLNKSELKEKKLQEKLYCKEKLICNLDKNKEL